MQITAFKALNIDSYLIFQHINIEQSANQTYQKL